MNDMATPVAPSRHRLFPYRVLLCGNSLSVCPVTVARHRPLAPFPSRSWSVSPVTVARQAAAAQTRRRAMSPESAPPARARSLSSARTCPAHMSTPKNTHMLSIPAEDPYTSNVNAAWIPAPPSPRRADAWHAYVAYIHTYTYVHIHNIIYDIYHIIYM